MSGNNVGSKSYIFYFIMNMNRRHGAYKWRAG